MPTLPTETPGIQSADGLAVSDSICRRHGKAVKTLTPIYIVTVTQTIKGAVTHYNAVIASRSTRIGANAAIDAWCDAHPATANTNRSFRITESILDGDLHE